MKKCRIISALLAVLMLVGSLSIIEVSAADDGTTYIGKDGEEKQIINYVTKVFKTPEEKLETMDVVIEDLYGYKVYVDYYSGEVAWTNLASGTDDVY